MEYLCEKFQSCLFSSESRFGKNSGSSERFRTPNVEYNHSSSEYRLTMSAIELTVWTAMQNGLLLLSLHENPKYSIRFLI